MINFLKQIGIAFGVWLYYLPKAMLVILVNFFGFIVIPIGLKFSYVVAGTQKPYAQYTQHGDHELVYLPDCLAIWNNLWDGVRGDKRGWYHNEYKGRSEFFRRVLWTAIRNPSNSLGRVFFSFDISNSVTSVRFGNPSIDEDTATWGFCLLQARDRFTNKKWYSFKMMYPVGFGRYVLWKSGYKFDLGDELQDFGNKKLTHTYQGVKALAEAYARTGYRKGSAMKALDRLVPYTARGLFPTIKKIKD